MNHTQALVPWNVIHQAVCFIYHATRKIIAVIKIQVQNDFFQLHFDLFGYNSNSLSWLVTLHFYTQFIHCHDYYNRSYILNLFGLRIYHGVIKCVLWEQKFPIFKLDFSRNTKKSEKLNVS